jgi:cysteine desulfurase
LTRVYLDNAATTRPDPAVLAAMASAGSETWANASSTHGPGREAALAVERARSVVARSLGARPEEVVFCSGGTEANNLAILGLVWGSGRRGGHLVTSAIEHTSVLRPLEWLEQQGWAVTRVGVDGRGLIDPAAVEAALRDDTLLVSIGQANGEIGTVQPIREIAALCRRRAIACHSDCCQAFLRVEREGAEPVADLISISAHKVHGPKGVGALRVRPGLSLAPLVRGGSQEGGLRAGTLNNPAILGFARAIEAWSPEHVTTMRRLRDRLLAGIMAGLPGVSLNGSPSQRVCSNLSLAFAGCSAAELAAELDRREVQVSRGAACASGSTRPSHVLSALGLGEAQALSSLRFSLGRFNTEGEIDLAVAAVLAAVATTRGAS